MKTPPIPDTTVDTELDQIIFDFWLNATSSTSGNPYQTAKDQATKAIKQLLTTEINISITTDIDFTEGTKALKELLLSEAVIIPCGDTYPTVEAIPIEAINKLFDLDKESD